MGVNDYFDSLLVTVQTCEVFTRVNVANYAQKPRKSPEGVNDYLYYYISLLPTNIK
jgi:hypothetical protein